MIKKKKKKRLIFPIKQLTGNQDWQIFRNKTILSIIKYSLRTKKQCTKAREYIKATFGLFFLLFH